MYKHGVARATHLGKCEQCRRLIDVRTLRVAWVRPLAIPGRGDVVNALLAELGWIDEGEEIGEKEARCDLLWRERIGGRLGAKGVLKSKFFRY
jgi:hypothetical protein